MFRRQQAEVSEYADDVPIWRINRRQDDLLHSDDGSTDSISDSGGDTAASALIPPEPVDVDPASSATPASGKRYFFWIRWICGWPKIMFTLTLLVQLTFVVVTGVLFAVDYPIFPVAFSDLPMENVHTMEYRRYVAWHYLTQGQDPVYTLMPSRRKRDTSENSSSRWTEENAMYLDLQLLYQLHEGQNILQQKYLERIRHFESIMKKHFKTPAVGSHCYVSSDTDSFFQGFKANSTEVRSPSLMDNYVGKNAVYNQTTNKVQTSLLRSTFYVAYFDDWVTAADYSLNTVRPRLKAIVDSVFKDITVYTWNFAMYGEAIKRQVFRDLLLFIGSVLFIFTFVLFQTASLWITFWGTTSIVISFLGANIMYDCVIGYRYFGLFNVLALFVVLGLGADDIFIFLDTWKSLDKRGLSMEERMSQTYKKAVLAMFNTSLTTTVAFMVNAFAPLLPIRTFGLFAGLTVIVNFFSVVVFFPTVVAVHHRHFEKLGCFGLGFNVLLETLCMRFHRRIAQFFGIQYYRVVTHKVVRWVIVVLFAVLLSGMSVSLSKLKVNEKSGIQLFISSNKLEKARNLKQYGFKKNVNDIPVQVLMIWGLKPRDVSSCHPTYYKAFHPCPGVGRFDDEFEIDKEENQLAMKKFCQTLVEAKLKHEDLAIKKSVCILEKFESTMKQLLNVSLPLTAAKVHGMAPFLEMMHIELNGTLQTPLSTMLYLWKEQIANNDEMIRFVRHNASEQPIGSFYGAPFYNMRVQFIVGAVVTSNMTVFDFSVDTFVKLKKSYEDFMEHEVSNMPPGLRRGYQACSFWSTLVDRLQVVRQGIMGVGVSLSLAFVLILLATQNIILAVLASLTLTSTVICVLGIMPLAGWSLGMLEGLNMVFVAGLAVDYILHVVLAYRIAEHQDRRERTQEALHAVGVSVVSGAITTLGSSAFIMFSQIEFFLQFGVFIFCTVGFSVVHAMVLFPALLSICGPSRNQGYILFFCKDSKRSDPSERDYLHDDDF